MGGAIWFSIYLGSLSRGRRSSAISLTGLVVYAATVICNVELRNQRSTGSKFKVSGPLKRRGTLYISVLPSHPLYFMCKAVMSIVCMCPDVRGRVTSICPCINLYNPHGRAISLFLVVLSIFHPLTGSHLRPMADIMPYRNTGALNHKACTRAGSLFGRALQVRKIKVNQQQ